jgi:hypothetical protein
MAGVGQFLPFGTPRLMRKARVKPGIRRDKERKRARRHPSGYRRRSSRSLTARSGAEAPKKALAGSSVGNYASSDEPLTRPAG